MIIITATLSFETEGDRDNAVTLASPVQKATRDEEAGCLAYCFAADPAEPTHIQVYELWTDPENLAKHFDHPNYAKMVEVLQNCGGFVSSENRLWAADDRGTVYGDDGAFRVDAVLDTGGKAMTQDPAAITAVYKAGEPIDCASGVFRFDPDRQG